MALSKEDKHDVKTHMGKALANKVSKVTRDDVIKGMNERRYTIKGQSLSRQKDLVKRNPNTNYNHGLKKEALYEKDWMAADKAELRRRKLDK